MARPRDGKLVRRISSSILEDSYIRLEEIANAEQGSVAQIIRRAVEEFIANRDVVDQPRLPLRRGQPDSPGS
jgi:hypothetical protein